MSVIQSVGKALGEMFAPLVLALEDVDSFIVFLQELGWDTAPTEDDFGAIQTLLPFADELGELLETVSTFGTATPGAIVEDVVNTADDILQTIKGLSGITSQSIQQLSPPLNTTAFWAKFALDVPEYLAITYIETALPPVYALLMLGGVIEVEVTEDDPPRTLHHLNWSQLTGLLSDPASQIASLYGWGSDEFAHQALLERLAMLGMSFGLKIERMGAEQAVIDQFYRDAAPPLDLSQLNLLFTNGVFNDVYVRAGLLVTAVPRAGESSVSGLYVGNILWGNLSAADTSPVQIEANTGPSGSVGLQLLPGDPPKFEGSATEVNFRLTLIGNPEAPYILIGEANGARLQLSGYELEMRIEGTVSEPEIVLRMATSGAGFQAIIFPADGDSFVRALLGVSELSVGAEIALEWSSKTGVTIEGGIGFDITFPLNLKLLFLTILELHLRLMIETTGAITAQADVDASAMLGPFTLTFADVGARAALTPSDDMTARGKFGGMEIAWAFKPPSGVGAAFDFLGLVNGGGYLEFDADASRYSGIVTIQMVALGITAIGIVTTEADNWSMFVSINVDLGSIPIGFGFTLEKVGGLVGVNRAIDTDAFLAGVRTGLLDSVMFPEDPIANATRILSDIEIAFPIAPGSFVFGAMLQIGWGTPTLITGSVGFIIQVPDVIIALLGQVETVLPTEDVPLIEIHFDVVGVLDLTAGTLAIDAGLRDSQIMGFVLTGQMAMRASFLHAPSFLLSMGGFHPAFPQPEGFPTLARMGIGLSVGDWLSIALETYIALTSNSVQFGAGLYLTANLVGFSIEGGTEINTLIYFKTFEFRANMSFFISVSAGAVELLGVRLTGRVSGPNPYLVKGTARFKILCLEQEVDIQETIGATTSIEDEEDVPVLEEVVTTLQAPSSWNVVDAGSRFGAVLLGDSTNGAVAVHPGGSVEVIQRFAPLEVQLEHYGSREIAGEDFLDISEVKAGGKAIAWEFAQNWFAPAMFFDMNEDEKLDAPSFEMMNAGLRIGDDDADSGTISDDIYTYEQIIYDPEFDQQNMTVKLAKSFKPAESILAGLQAQIRPMTSRLQISRKSIQRYTLDPVRYVVVERDSLKGTSRSITYAEARQQTGSGQIVVTSSERRE